MRPKYIVVLGSSYCGSTLFARLATLIPNAKSVGELHWVVDDRYDWDCRRCYNEGRACPVDWRAFRPGPQSELYQRTREHFGVETLITTDKIPGVVERLADPAEVYALVLWKRPEAMVASYRRHKEGEDSFVYHYPRILKWAKQKCASVKALRYEDLARNPSGTMATLCQECGLDPFPSGSIDYGAIDYHVMGGNLEAHTRDSVEVDLRWQTELTLEEQDRIVNDPEVRSIVSDLLKLSV